MKKSTRADKARETLAIIEQGFYQVNGRTIEIKEQVKNAVDQSLLYRQDDFDPVMERIAARLETRSYSTKVNVENATVLDAAAALRQEGTVLGCLNFASAKNPGGGFLGGAQAQEESLARSSFLYPTLMRHYELYEFNRSRRTYLYSDHMIFSPDTLVIRDDEGDLLSDPYPLSFVTSPAVNIGAIKNHNPAEMGGVEAAMIGRMDKMLGVFVDQGIEHLLLGAWGCGVFQNNPVNVARYFASFLLGDGKYSKCFQSVVFAVPGRSKGGENYEAFREAFK